MAKSLPPGDELLPVDEALQVGDLLQTGDPKPLPNRSARMSTAETEYSVVNQNATVRLQKFRTPTRMWPHQARSFRPSRHISSSCLLTVLLIPRENAEQYDALPRSLIQQLGPTDAIEAIWVKDFSDSIWEAKRLRRWRRQILVQARKKAAEELVDQSSHDASSQELSDLRDACAAALAVGEGDGSNNGMSETDKILQERGLTEESIAAEGFLLNLPAIERIDRLSLAADQRRDQLLREIERKRASFAHQVRSATGDVLDVGNTEVR